MSEFAKKVDVASALTAREVYKYDYVILNMMSSLELMPVSDVLKTDADGNPAQLYFDPEELLEARFFSDEAELHIFRDSEDNLSAVLIRDEFLNDEYETCDVRYQTQSGKTLVVREYLKADEDGQMCAVLTRAAGIE